jgi:NADH:ubiquinone oxidoreductase subunit K
MGTVLDAVVGAVLAVTLVALLVGRPPTGLRLPVVAVAAVAAVWRGLGDGPVWLLWLVGVIVLICAVHLALGIAVARRMRPADPQVLRAEVLAVAAGDAPPEQIVLGVAPGGALLLTGVRQEGVLLTYGCPICFLEDVVQGLVGPDAPVVDAYRRQVLGGTNRLVDLHRGVIDGLWHADLRPVRGAQRPFRPPFCPVHAV